MLADACTKHAVNNYFLMDTLNRGIKFSRTVLHWGLQDNMAWGGGGVHFHWKLYHTKSTLNKAVTYGRPKDTLV